MNPERRSSGVTEGPIRALCPGIEGVLEALGGRDMSDDRPDRISKKFLDAWGEVRESGMSAWRRRAGKGLPRSPPSPGGQPKEGIEPCATPHNSASTNDVWPSG